MPIHKLIRRSKHVLHPEQTIQEAAQAMRDDDQTAVLVVANDDIVGILTEYDVVRRVVAAGLDAATTRVGAVMTPGPICVDGEESSEVADNRMREHGVRHLAVRGAEATPVGVVQATDVLRWRVESLMDSVRSLQSFLGADSCGG